MQYKDLVKIKVWSIYLLLYHMAGLAFDCLINEKYLTMKLTEFREFVQKYGFTGIRKENWHYQAIKLPDGYKNIIEVIKSVGNWKG